MKYITKLKNIIRKNKSNIVVGLDSEISKIPLFFLKYKNPVLEFNKRIIDATKESSAGYKINTAFYEAEGAFGFSTLEETVKYIPDNLIKICDAKRGDIGNTAEMYAKAFFENMDFDAIAVNPYMGKDAVEPFLKRKDKFVYILAHTSNKGAEDFQKLITNRKPLFINIIEKSLEWNKNNNIGFVIGANHTKLIKEISSRKPEIPLLIPGIGAQGNDLEILQKNLFNKIYIINSSRGIIYSSPKNTNEKKFIAVITESLKELNYGFKL